MTVTAYLNWIAADHVKQRPDGAYFRFLCDTESELPSTGIVNGDRAYATDTGKRYVRSGGSWVTQDTDSVANDIILSDETVLTFGAVSDGQYLKRDGTSVIGGTPSGGPGGEAFPIGSVFIAVVSTNPGTLLGYGTWSAFGAGKVLIGLDSGDADFDTVEETGGAKTKTIAQANLPNISTGAGTAHTHTQDAHTHTQDSHNHTQNAHTHDFLPRSATTGAVSSIVTGTLDTSSTISGSNQPHVQNATATNQAATAVNQNATATNQNESAHTHSLGGSGTALNVMNPYIVCFFWKRTA